MIKHSFSEAMAQSIVRGVRTYTASRVYKYSRAIHDLESELESIRVNNDEDTPLKVNDQA